MATGNTYGNLYRPSGRGHLGMFTSPESALAQYLYPIMWRDAVFVFDDFTGAVLSTHLWTAAGVNGTNFDPPSTQLANGVCTGVSSTTATDQNSIRSDAIWLGDQNCGAEFRFKIDNQATSALEMGFNDPMTSYTASTDFAVTGIDTPAVNGANGVTDVAMVARITSETANTLNLITDGGTANMNATATSLAVSPTNATYMTVRVQLAGNAAHAYVLDANDAVSAQAQHGSATASQIEGGTLVEARLAVQTVTGARTVDVDYIAIWQDRRT